MIEFAHSALAARGFASSDPGRRHGTAHQAMLRRHPTQQRQKDLQLEYTTMYWGVFGEKKGKKKEDWQQMLAQVPIFKKKKKLGSKNLKGMTAKSLSKKPFRTL